MDEENSYDGGAWDWQNDPALADNWEGMTDAEWNDYWSGYDFSGLNTSETPATFGDLDINSPIEWSQADGLWYDPTDGSFYDMAGFLVENYTPLTEQGSGLVPRDDNGDGFPDYVTPSDVSTSGGFFDGFGAWLGGLFSGGSSGSGGGFSLGGGGITLGGGGKSADVKSAAAQLAAAQAGGASAAQVATLRLQLLQSQQASAQSVKTRNMILAGAAVAVVGGAIYYSRKK